MERYQMRIGELLVLCLVAVLFIMPPMDMTTNHRATDRLEMQVSTDCALSRNYGLSPQDRPDIPFAGLIRLYWNSTIGGPNDDSGSEVVECRTGGFAITGHTDLGMDGDADIWLVRTDAAGNHLWNRTYGGSEDDRGRSIVECSNDGFLLACYTRSFGAGNRDVWLVRVDLNGTHLWNTTIGSPYDDWPQAAIECSTGGFAIAGATNQSGVDYDGWLVRIDGNGNQLWNRTYGGPNTDLCNDLVECDNGGFALAGYTESYASPNGDAWLLRTDSTGVPLWNATYGADEGEYAFEMVKVSSGGFALVGYTESYVPGYAAYLVRTDDSGACLWNRTYSYGSIALGCTIAEHQTGGFVWAGYYLAQWWDPLIVRVDQSGGVVSYRDEYESGEQQFEGMTECRDGGFALTGYTTDRTAGGEDVWLVRLAEDVPPVWVEPPPALIQHEAGGPFRYDLNASDASGVSHYTLGASQFTINATTGVIVNATVLYVFEGEYYLHIRAYDVYDNYVYSVITVTVRDTTPPQFEPPPPDVVLEYPASDFSIRVEVADISGISDMWVNDTTNFQCLWMPALICGWGHLDVGAYGVRVWAKDPWGNVETAVFGVTVVDTTPPSWSPMPSDVHVQVGTKFAYSVSAVDSSGVDHWWINDTIHFSINNIGTITNVTSLDLGTYGLEVRACDPYDNYCSAKLVVYVEPSLLPTPIPGFPTLGLILGFLAAIGAASSIRRRRTRRAADWDVSKASSSS